MDFETQVHTALQNGMEGREFLRNIGEFPVNNILPNSRKTLLHLAVAAQNVSCVEALISAVADLNSVDSEGNTPIFIAAEVGNLSILRILLMSGASFSEKNRDGDTALHLAARNGHSHIVKALTDSFASTSVTNNLGKTPIDLAQRLDMMTIMEPESQQLLHDPSRTNDQAEAMEDEADSQPLQGGNNWTEGGFNPQVNNETTDLVKLRAREVMSSPVFPNIRLLRQSISVVNADLGTIIETGVLPLIVQLALGSEDIEMLYECLWIICNVYSGSSSNCQYMNEKGGLTAFAQHLTHPLEKISAICTWGLSNIAGDCAEMRNLVVQTPNLLGNFIHLIKQAGPSSERETLENIGFLASNIARTKPYIELPLAFQAAMVALFSRIGHVANDTVVDCIWFFAFTCDNTPDILLKAGVAGVMPMIFDGVKKPEMHHLRLLGALSTESEEACALMLPYLPLVIKALQNPKLRKEALWTISNVVHDSDAAAMEVVKVGFFHSMESAEVSTLSRDETSELGWILTNAMEKPYLIQYIKESRHFDEYRYMSHQYEHLGTNWASYIGEQ